MIILAQKKQGSFPFRIVKAIVRLFYPKTELIGKELLPDEPVVIVGNHAQLHGPLVGELYFPDNCYIWCASQMMKLRDVPKYAYKDFWSYKPAYIRWLFKIVSYIIAPISVFLFNNARTVPVYHDARIISTIRKSMKLLDEGCSIIIFPEHDQEYNGLLYDFQDRFIDLARFYYKKSGKNLSFVPMYIAPTLKKTYFSEPITFDPSNDIAAERERIKHYLMDSITSLAVSLPEHTVTPYRNISKKHYITNKCVDTKEENNEKAGS